MLDNLMYGKKYERHSKWLCCITNLKKLFRENEILKTSQDIAEMKEESLKVIHNFNKIIS